MPDLLEAVVDAIGIILLIAFWIILFAVVGAVVYALFLFSRETYSSVGLLGVVITLSIVLFALLLALLARWIAKGIFYRTALVLRAASVLCALAGIGYVVLPLLGTSEAAPAAAMITQGLVGILVAVALMIIPSRRKVANG